MTPVRPPAAAVLLLAALALAGCTSQETVAAPRPQPSLTYTADSPVEIPGRPGETPRVLPPGSTGTLENPDAYGDADVAFVRDMALHHAQALEMAALAPGRAQDPRVTALAGRIAAAQQPEIDLMQAWLEQKGLPRVDLASGSHGAMPGMATQEQLFGLRQATGRAFDRSFLQLMTAHHEGALKMAEGAKQARNLVVQELVQDVAVKQSVEIDRMARVAADLGEA